MAITFRSDYDADFKCLEHYLESGDFGHLPDTALHQAQHDIKKLNEVMTSLAETAPWLSKGLDKTKLHYNNLELPTRYDSPFNFRIIDGLVISIKSAIKKMGWDEADFPHYSSIPTRQVNACAVNLQCSKKTFLLFDSQILLYCHLFSKAFARCLPATSNGKNVQLSTEIDLVKTRIKNSPDVMARFKDVLHSFVTTDAPSNAKSYPIESDYAQMATIIRLGMELFVVAHEFGHVYSGHLSDLLYGFRLNAIDSVEANNPHKQEYEADFIGLVLTLHAMSDSNYDAALSYIGVDLFFVSLDLAERYSHLINGGDDAKYQSTSSDSHPSNELRRMMLSQHLEYLIQDKTERVAAQTIKAQYEAITLHLWECVKDSYLNSSQSVKH